MLPSTKGGESPITRPPAPIVGANSSNIGLPAPVVGAKFPTTKLRAPVVRAVFSTTRLVTLQLDGIMGEKKSLYVFGKYFTKFSKIKHFTTFFIKDFIVNGKYFTSLTLFYLQTNT